MKREKLSSKILVLGVDGMDPRLTRKYVSEGKMPNVKTYIDRGACRDDLVMLGSQPTVTPPQWTTLATGCNPVVHGITQFYRTTPELDAITYNLDSRLCKAEQVWNVFAEAGIKTCVFHWPGASWPPSSDSENLIVIDGSGPGGVAMAACQMEEEVFIGADESIKEIAFIPQVASDAMPPCTIDELPKTVLEDSGDYNDKFAADAMIYNYIVDEYNDGMGIKSGGFPKYYDVAKSSIKPAINWVDAPADAKEFVMLLSHGMIHRPCLILKNEDGLYDHVAIYKSKKDTTPLAVLYVDKMVPNIIDDVYKDEKFYQCTRNYLLLELGANGDTLRIFVSAAMDINNNNVFHPKDMHKKLTDAAGPIPPSAQLWSQDPDVIIKCMIGCWDVITDWYDKCLHYLIEEEDVEVIFSHFHSIDLEAHTFVRYMKDQGHNQYPESVYENYMELLYKQIDDYLGRFLHYLDEDWSIIIVSDHALLCPTNEPPLIGDMGGCNIGLMRELGYCSLKTDENGNEIKEMDWSKTRAVQVHGNDIFINLKGRNPNGIVDPEDQYELEEQIMTDLYGYRDPKTGKRVIALALRKKDAILLGYGGETAGDIFFATAEGYNYDHCDALSTTLGEKSTSVSPIFIAAGKGFKTNYRTERIIRQVDFVPTVAILGGVRMPKQCEGAPVYQIFDEEI